jgi:hypothetical protein
VISAVSGAGVPDVLRALIAVIENARGRDLEPTDAGAGWQP